MERAIAIATDLFHRRGYDGVGIAELSKQIGITAPSLYSAFGNKRSLFEKVLEQYVKNNSGWLVTSLSSSESLEACIKILFARAADVYTADKACLGCLALDGSRNCGDAGARALTAGYRKKTWQLIYDRITADARSLDEQAATTLASYVMTILLGLSASARDGNSADELQAVGEIAAAGFSQKLSRLLS